MAVHIGVHVYVAEQFIGESELSRQFPECSGNELNLSDCLLEHPFIGTQCMAKRILVLCFPNSTDPQKDLPLCGIEPPFTTTSNKLPTVDESSTASADHESPSVATKSTSDITESSSGFSLQSINNSAFVIFCLGVLLYIAASQ